MGELDQKFLSEDNLKNVIDTIVERYKNGNETIQFPDKTYALGGAGKSLVFELLETEWFLVELLIDENRSTTTFHFIDSETEYQTTEQNKINDIEQRINTIEKILENNHGITNTPRVRIQQSHLTSEMQVSSISDFIGEDVVNDVLTHSNDPDADTWWIDKNTLLDRGGDMHNLAKGAIRRRSLSKAFYYKAQSETTFQRDHLNLLSDDEQVAIVAGIGGGTGSGMFLDLAREIRRQRDDVRITFFGVMPAKGEGSNERANAYAALSELEYLALSDAKSDEDTLSTGKFPFADVVLTPIDPTEHQTGIDDNPKIDNFDLAYVYVLISYYNTQNIDTAFEHETAYAPFTVAIPQLLRYNVQQIREARQKVETVLSEKSEAIDAEKRLHEQIKQFISEYYDAGTHRLSKSDAKIIERRVQNLLEFVQNGTFSNSPVASYVEGILNDPSEGSLEDTIDDIEFALAHTGDSEGHTPRENPYADHEEQQRPDELDETAKDRINEELYSIKSMYNILQLKRGIEHEPVRQMIDFFFDPKTGTEKAREINDRLSATLENLDGSQGEEGLIRQKETRLSELETELEQTRTEQQDKVDRILSSWSRESDDAINRLVELKSIDINNELQRLQNNLDGFTKSIRSTEGTEIKTVGSDVTNPLDQIKEELPSKDRDEVEQDRRKITSSIRDVRSARQEYVKINQAGVTDQVKRLLGGGSDQSDYEEIAIRINEQGVFKIPLDPEEDFWVELQYSPSLVEKIGKEKDDIKAYLIEQFENIVKQETERTAIPSAARDEYQTKLEAVSNRNGQDLRSNLEDIVRRIIEAEVTNIDSIKTDIEELEAEIVELEQKHKAFKNAFDLYRGVAKDVKTYKKAQKSFEEYLENPFSGPTGTDDDHEVYASIKTPEDLSDTTDSGSISDSDLLSANGNELTEIRNHFMSCVEDRFLNQSYNGLDSRSISTPDDRKNFNETQLCIALSGDIFTEGASVTREKLFEKANNKLRGNLGIHNQDDQFWRWTVANGGLWDISMCVFLQGITFLDNLEPVTSRNRGYEDTYHKRTGDAPLNEQIQRHVYGLEQGFFVHRSKTFPITEAENQRLFVSGKTNDIVAELFDAHTITEFDNLHLQQETESYQTNNSSDAEDS